AVFADGAALVLPGSATGLAGLVAALIAFGAVHGTLNVAMNVNAVEVQRAWQRPIVTSFHAVYSIGGFLGAAARGLFASAGLGAAPAFLSVAGLVACGAVLAARWVQPFPPDPSARPGPGRTPLPGVAFLGVLVFCCLVGEGAAADWSTVYLRDTLG